MEHLCLLASWLIPMHQNSKPVLFVNRLNRHYFLNEIFKGNKTFIFILYVFKFLKREYNSVYNDATIP